VRVCVRVQVCVSEFCEGYKDCCRSDLLTVDESL